MQAPKVVTSLAELNDLAGSGKLQGLFSLPIELYHEGPGISSTGLKELLKSPAHYQAYLREEQEDTAALRFGRLAHLMILEPHLYWQNVATEPKCDGRTTEGKRIRAEFAAESVGKEIITEDESLKLGAMGNAARSHPLVAKILSKGLAEVSVYWIDAETGVLCKARADWLRGETIFDLKTCWSASLREFQRAVQSYRYDLSGSFYMDGFATVQEIKHFSWIAVEKTAPYAFGFYAADQELLNAGRADYRKALETYAECQRTGLWPGYAQEFVNLSLTGV